MPAHGMAKNTLPVHIRAIDSISDQARQFLHHVGVHAIVFRPGLTRCVDIEPRALPEVVFIRRIRHIVAPRTGVGAHYNHARFSRPRLKSSFCGDILPRAGEARQVSQDWNTSRIRLRRCEDGDFRGTAQFSAVVHIYGLAATKAIPL